MSYHFDEKQYCSALYELESVSLVSAILNKNKNPDFYDRFIIKFPSYCLVEIGNICNKKQYDIVNYFHLLDFKIKTYPLFRREKVNYHVFRLSFPFSDTWNDYNLYHHAYLVLEQIDYNINYYYFTSYNNGCLYNWIYDGLYKKVYCNSFTFSDDIVEVDYIIQLLYNSLLINKDFIKKEKNKNEKDTITNDSSGNEKNIKQNGDGNVKHCKKCNTNFPDNFTFCPKCGGTLTPNFWDKEVEIGCVLAENGQRFRIIKGTKNNIDYVSIGKQFYSNSDKDYKYKDAVAIPTVYIKQLISILQKML